MNEMYITALTHRDELFDLTLRWLNDDFNVEDGSVVTRIFFYESAISAAVVDRMIEFLGNIFTRPLHVERIPEKRLLRERIIQYLPRQSLRSRQLTNIFRENPEYFFPRLPIDAVMITGCGPRLAAIGRIKRLSRVAEKVSFRLADALFREIKAEAQSIAEQRAVATGVPLAALISSDQEMRKDFVEAEEVVARRFRNKNVRIDREALTVNDLVGFKIIGDPDVLGRVPRLLQEVPGLTLVETEEYTGVYNASNVLVDVELPPPDELAALQGKFDASIAVRRGLDAGQTQKGFAAYLTQGARSVRLEIILTTYDDLMESEFGRSMHELRVLRLRQQQAYSGPIAQNAGYLIEYLLTLAAAPVVAVPELPVKMYGRYLPESIVAAKCALFGNEIDGGLLNAFCMKSDCPSRFCSTRRGAGIPQPP